MKSVYVFGPIHLFGKDYIPVYKELTKLCEKYFNKVICTYPHFWDTKEGPNDFYDRTIHTITKYDLFIAEVSSPSHGVGMELQMAFEHDIPIIALAQEGIKISLMVMGLPNLKKIIYYENITDLCKKLENEIRHYSKSI